MIKDLDKIKIRFMVKGSIFLQTLLFSIPWIESKDIPTAATNGKELFINPDWFNTLSIQEKVGLLAHEAWHIAYQHMHESRKELDQKIYNVACDYLINLQLLKDKYELPEGAYVDKRFAGLSSMQIYEKLLEESPEADPMKMDLVYGELTEEEKERANIQLIEAVKTEESYGKGIGDLPGEIKRYVNKLLNPTLPWNLLLLNYMDAYNKDNYSWKRPNRRYEEYLPSLYSEAIGNMGILIDASGSIQKEDLEVFLTEIQSIIASVSPSEVAVASFDTELYPIPSVEWLLENQSVRGYGGTADTPICEFIEKERPNVLVIFTDGELYTDSLEQLAYQDIIWVIKDNPRKQMSIGSTIHIEN